MGLLKGAYYLRVGVFFLGGGGASEWLNSFANDMGPPCSGELSQAKLKEE